MLVESAFSKPHLHHKGIMLVNTEGEILCQGESRVRNRLDQSTDLPPFSHYLPDDMT